MARTVGDNIKLLRERAGLSQRDLAERLEATPPTVNNWESGRRVDLKVPSLIRIAKALEQPVEALFEELDDEYETWRRARSIDDEVAALWTRLTEPQQTVLVTAMRVFLGIERGAASTAQKGGRAHERIVRRTR